MLRMSLTVAASLGVLACKPLEGAPPESRVDPTRTTSPDGWAIVLSSGSRVGPTVAGAVSFEEAYGVSVHDVRVAQTEAEDTFSGDFPVLPFTAAANGEGGMLWRVAGGLVYRTPDVTGALTAVEGINATSVAVAGEQGFACTYAGELMRISMQGEPESTQVASDCDEVQARGRSLFVRDATQAWRVSNDGGETFAAADAPGPEALRVTGSLQWRRPKASDDTAPDLGHTWAFGDDESTNVRGPELRFHEPDAPLSVPEGLGCRVGGTNSGLAAVCSGTGSGTLSVVRVFDWRRQGWKERAALPEALISPGGGVIDAMHGGIAFRGPCASGSPDDGRKVGACVVDPQGEPTTVWWTAEAPESTPAGRLSLRQFEAPLLVYGVGGPKSPSQIVQLELGPAVPLPPCREPRLVGWRHLECAEIEGIALWAIGSHPPEPIEVPAGAASVAFASPTRGLAAGERADALWSTLDGGRTWTPLQVRMRGSPASMPVGQATCTNTACAAEPVGWAPVDLIDKRGVVSAQIVGFDTPVDLSRVAEDLERGGL